MDEATGDLIAQFSSRIAMLMEDGSVIALAAGGPHLPNRVHLLTELRQLVDEIQALTQAAVALATQRTGAAGRMSRIGDLCDFPESEPRTR